jgi:DNA (cytosine-5)-methyltransferase 1
VHQSITPPPPRPHAPRAAEFFAGIGLARIGLEQAGCEVVWSNDIEPDKCAMYLGHFGDGTKHVFDLRDIAKVRATDLPDNLDLAWASFPCTDLSLAGSRRGIHGSESGTFWHFTRVLDEMDSDRPRVVVLENVVGLATSNGGADLAAAISELNRLDYSVDVLTLDARRFVPQSRPRLFLVGAVDAPADSSMSNSILRPGWLQGPFDDPDLRTHRAVLPDPPEIMNMGLSALAEDLAADDEAWWDDARAERFLSSLSPIQRGRLKALEHATSVSRRTAYRRTRGGIPVWEIRSDGISGCLRTARGGSSKQALVEAGQGAVRVRWMTPREYARLMGADDYRLNDLRDNQALFGFGDAVCVPAVRWLAENYLVPLMRNGLRPGRNQELVAALA